MSLVEQPTLGLQEIQRQAFFVLFDNLNDVLSIIESHWIDHDEEFAIRTGRTPFTPTSLEPVDGENFHEGHTPSLVNAPVEKYPNCAVMAYQAVPAAGSDSYDQIDVYRDTLAVDVMVRSSASEEEVNRRSHRMTEAANICVMQNKTLNGIIHGHETGPSIVLGDVFTRKERTAYGQHWFWQGARLTYALRKEARGIPTDFTEASIFSGSEIDQG